MTDSRRTPIPMIIRSLGTPDDQEKQRIIPRLLRRAAGLMLEALRSRAVAARRQGRSPGSSPGAEPGIPHPLDMDIRRTPHKTRHIDAGGRDVTVYVGDCPDGCGQLIAWTDTMLPFNASDLDELAAIIVRSYEVTALPRTSPPAVMPGSRHPIPRQRGRPGPAAAEASTSAPPSQNPSRPGGEGRRGPPVSVSGLPCAGLAPRRSRRAAGAGGWCRPGRERRRLPPSVPTASG